MSFLHAPRLAKLLLPVALSGALLTGCGKKNDGRGWWEVWKDGDKKGTMANGSDGSLILPPPMDNPNDGLAGGSQLPLDMPLMTEPGSSTALPSFPEVTKVGVVLPDAARISPSEAVPNSLQIVHFVRDSSILTEEAKAQLKANAQWIINNLATKPSMIVQLAGHCDERGSNEYNMALGENRALTAREYMFSLGVPYAQMMTISYGEERPRNAGHNDAAYSDNRRVEFLVYE